MTIRRFAVCALFVLAAVGAAAFAAGVTGLWTAAIDTQIGEQNYTYDFKVDGEKLTGTAKSQFSQSPIIEGSVKGDAISFVENLTYQDMTMRVVYTGTISGDEIKFNRKVGDIASEDFVAKRAK
jgi:major membrane immunogen (membrane-anchored lipoprotein)